MKNNNLFMIFKQVSVPLWYFNRHCFTMYDGSGAKEKKITRPSFGEDNEKLF